MNIGFGSYNNLFSLIYKQNRLLFNVLHYSKYTLCNICIVNSINTEMMIVMKCIGEDIVKEDDEKKIVYQIVR